MALKTPASHVIIAWHNPEVIILFGNAAGSKVKREQGSNPALVNIQNPCSSRDYCTHFVEEVAC